MATQVSSVPAWTSRESPWFCVHHDHMYCSTARTPPGAAVVQVLPTGSASQRRQITQVTDQHGKTITLSLLKPNILGDEAGGEVVSTAAATGVPLVTSPAKAAKSPQKGITFTLLTQGDQKEMTSPTSPTEAKRKQPISIKIKSPAKQKGRKDDGAKSQSKKVAASPKSPPVKKGPANKRGKAGARTHKGSQKNGEESTDGEVSEEAKEDDVKEDLMRPKLPDNEWEIPVLPGSRNPTKRQLSRQKNMEKLNLEKQNQIKQRQSEQGQTIEAKSELAMHLLSPAPMKLESQGIHRRPTRRKLEVEEAVKVEEETEEIDTTPVRVTRKSATPETKKATQKNKQSASKDITSTETLRRSSQRGKKENEMKPKEKIPRKRGRSAALSKEEEVEKVKEESSEEQPKTPPKKRKKSEDVVEKGKAKKTKKSPPSNKRQKKVNESTKVDKVADPGGVIKFIPCDIAAAAGDPWGQAVPMEILVKIFDILIKDVGFQSVIGRISQVCKLWYEGARHQTLWQVVDLSGDHVKKNKKTLHWLCKNRMKDTLKLDVTGWTQLAEPDIKIVTKNCQALETLNLSKCNRLGSQSMKLIADHCHNLQHFDISHGWAQAVSNKPMNYFMEKRGAALKSLNLSWNVLTKFDSVILDITKKCKKLEVLELDNCMFSTNLLRMPLEKLQISCPNLRVFSLTNSLVKVNDVSRAEQSRSLGFPALETISVARSTVGGISKFRYVHDQVLTRFLKNSIHLRSLDVSGCRHITAEGLRTLPPLSLEKLFISQCRATNQPAFKDAISNWSHSLRILDMSGNSVDLTILREILMVCQKLQMIDLNGCRGLPMNMRKIYSNEEILELSPQLAALQDDGQQLVPAEEMDQ